MFKQQRFGFFALEAKLIKHVGLFCFVNRKEFLCETYANQCFMTQMVNLILLKIIDIANF
jgi:hypothetical protein